MAMELVREPLRIKRIIGEESLQFSVQGDLIIPDSKPDLLNVLSVDSSITVNEREITADKVVLGGVVNFNIIYLAKDEERPIRSLNASVSFREPVEISGIRQGMMLDIEAAILNSAYEILNERKILVEAVAQISIDVSERVEAGIIVDTYEQDNVEKLQENFEVCQFIGECSDRLSIKEEVDLPESMPAVFEILKTEARISKEIKLSDNKIIINGEVIVKSIYSADDEERSIQNVEYAFPFTEFLDISGIDENAFCEVDTSAVDMSAAAEENTEGELRILRYKGSVEFFARAFMKEQKQMVVDMYSPDYMIDLGYQELAANQMVKKTENEIILKDEVQLPEKTDVGKVYSILCSPVVTDVKVEEEKVTVNGVVEVKVIYSYGEGNIPSSCKYEVPFVNSIDVREAEQGMMYKIKVETVSCSYNMAFAGELDIKIVLRTEVTLYKNTNIKIIDNADEAEIDEASIGAKPSMIIYFVQPGDTLWKIGKKFNVSLRELIRINSLANPDQLAVGQLIIIPKKQLRKVYIK